MPNFLRIHTTPTDEEGSTWLQLFFDLVYVAILVELGNRLSHNLHAPGIFEFIVFYVPIWWSWLGFVDYGRRYPIDDIGQRVLTVAYMSVMLIMAFEIHALTGATANTFVLSIVGLRFILAIMYVRAWIHFPQYRTITGQRAAVFVLIGIAWLCIAIWAPTNLVLWLLASALGILVPGLLGWLRGRDPLKSSASPPIKHHFTLHRFGELTIIVLGEFFIKLVTSSTGRELNLGSGFIGISLLAISVSIWWLYFDHLEHANLARAGSHVRSWIYAHYPFFVSITAYGVIGNKVFSAAPLAPLDEAKRLMFATVLAISVIAFAFIEWASREQSEPLARRPQPWVRVISAALLLALGNFGAGLNAIGFVLIVAAIFVLQVGLDIHMRIQNPEPESSQAATLT